MFVARRPLEEEEYPKCRPTRFSAVIGWPGSNEPEQPQRWIKWADISARSTLPPLSLKVSLLAHNLLTQNLHNLLTQNLPASKLSATALNWVGRHFVDPSSSHGLLGCTSNTAHSCCVASPSPFKLDFVLVLITIQRSLIGMFKQ